MNREKAEQVKSTDDLIIDIHDGLHDLEQAIDSPDKDFTALDRQIDHLSNLIENGVLPENKKLELKHDLDSLISRKKIIEGPKKINFKDLGKNTPDTPATTKTDESWIIKDGESVTFPMSNVSPKIESIEPEETIDHIEKLPLQEINSRKLEERFVTQQYLDSKPENNIIENLDKDEAKEQKVKAELLPDIIEEIREKTAHLKFRDDFEYLLLKLEEGKETILPTSYEDLSAILRKRINELPGRPLSEIESSNITESQEDNLLLENILAAKKETPFKEPNLDEDTNSSAVNLDLSSHIELEEMKENLASTGLMEDIEKVESRAEKLMAEIEALPEDKKEKTIYTLNTLGYQIDKLKNNKIADLLEKSASTLSDPNKNGGELKDQGTLTRFLHGLAKGRRLKAEQTENIIGNIQAGKTGLMAQGGNLGRPIGTALKVGRILGDFNIANPLRHVMFIASTTEEISRGAKEARLSSDSVLRKKANRKTGLKWHEKKALREKGQEEGKTEEEIENEISTQETARETETNLNNTLYGSLTRKMRSYDELKDKRKKLQRFARVISKGNKDINKLDEARLLLSGMTQGIAQWQNKFWLDRVQKKLNKIEGSSLSIEKKEARKQKLFASYENKLKDMERMMSGYGAIDILAMTARNVENASKAVVIGMMADSLYKAGKYAYENDMFGFMDWAEKIIEGEKNTPDDLESDVLPINPTYTEPIKVSLADSGEIVDPETIKKSRFSLFENTGATVIEDPQGKVSVTYEIGNNGDFNSLDQALRRVVMQAYDDQTPNVFDKVEAARLENTLANVREILQGQTINGITPLQIKESAQLVDGNLVISDYNKFDQEILKPLFKRAAEKIDQDSPIIKYSQATNESVWQEMLGEKNGSKIASIEPSFAKEVTPPENLPSEFTNNEINEIKRTSVPVEPNILNGSEPIEDLKHIEIKTPTPSLLDQASSAIQTRFRLPEESADKIVNTLMIDSKGNLDQNQLQIFNDIANRTQNPDAVFSALDITRSLNWDSGQEMKLARAFVNPEKINLWQDVFGKDMVPENAKVKIDGTKMSLHKVGGMGGALSIDFAEQKITLGRLLRPGGNGWATDSARFFHFSPSSQNTFGEALSKATQAVRQAK